MYAEADVDHTRPWGWQDGWRKSIVRVKIMEQVRLRLGSVSLQMDKMGEQKANEIIDWRLFHTKLPKGTASFPNLISAH